MLTHPAGDRLTDLAPPVANPGALRFRSYIPADLPANAPLVVVLHGCTQTAAAYDHGAGWSTLADEKKFALLFPEQVPGNNANRCFNWFVPADIARQGGEAESIAQATTAMIAHHDIDPARVFVTGLSAGGAMTAVMLATWPDLFAGGAIIGGLPYGTATSMGEALAGMHGQGEADATRLAATVNGAAPAPRRRPSVSIWHGTADSTVVVGNLDRLGKQWRGVHDLGDQASVVTTGKNWERNVWVGDDGREVVEEWRIVGMGHGVPIDTGALGAAGPYMLDVALSSTTEIARGWGLVGAAETVAARPAAPPPRATPIAAPATPFHTGTGSVQATIETALRSAGLMR